MARFGRKGWLCPAAMAVLIGCSPEPGNRPQAAETADPAPAADRGNQGIVGRFEVLSGAHPRDPGCGNLAAPAARDSCQAESRRRMGAPLQGWAVIVDAAGDSSMVKLDSLGGFRATVPPGRYTVCARSDRMPVLPLHIRCQERVEVAPGAFTPFLRALPMP